MKNLRTENWIAILSIFLFVVFGIWGMCISAYSVTGYALYSIAAVATGTIIWAAAKAKSKSGNVVIGYKNNASSISYASAASAPHDPMAEAIEFHVKVELNEES